MFEDAIQQLEIEYLNRTGDGGKEILDIVETNR